MLGLEAAPPEGSPQPTEPPAPEAFAPEGAPGPTRSGRARLQALLGAPWTRGVQGVAFALALGAAAAGSVVLFRMLNRTRVHGLQHLPREHENVLYCLNHNSILDNFAFEAAVYIPKILFQPRFLPISLADRKNFFGDPASRKLKDKVLSLLGRHFFSHLRAHPVDREEGDLEQVNDWVRLLKENIVIVFPEGTRTRTGEIGPGKPGVGRLIYEAHPTVIPVRMMGTGEVLGVGRKIPRLFRTVEVWIGAPLDLGELLERPLPEARRDQVSLYAEISDRVIQEIKSLGPGTALEGPQAPPPDPPEGEGPPPEGAGGAASAEQA